MKYDFGLSLEEHTSVGKIIRQIKEGSKVLEFGPGNGRMTKYLIAEKKCEVAIVEFDEELYRFVMEFATDGFLGNIEDYRWADYFADQKYDYIIFADVLEHLVDSQKALANAREFLKPEGRILLTFPNLAHNSVLIGLFNNQLPWDKYGLLDATHNSFYTQSGFEKIFQELDLHIEIEDFTYAQVGQNELAANYENLPITSRYDFQNRPFGEVYQYFYSLMAKPVEEPMRALPENSNFVKKVQIVFQYADHDELSELLYNNFTGENKQSVLEVPESVKAIRIVVIGEDAILRFSAESNEQQLEISETNATWHNQDTYLFCGETESPYFVIAGGELAGKQLTLHFETLSENQFNEIEAAAYQDLSAENANLIEEAQQLKETLLKETAQIKKMQRRAEIQNKLQQKDIKYTDFDPSKQQYPFNLNIESIEYDPDENQTVVIGWGYEKTTGSALQIDLPYSISTDYTLSSLLRPDVNETFDLPENTKVGFSLVIQEYQPKKELKLVISHQEQLYPLKFSADSKNNQPLLKRFRRAAGLVKRNGIKGAYQEIQRRRKYANDYEEWIAENETFDLAEIQTEIANFKLKPTISLAVPVYNVEEKWLRACVKSLQDQFYPHWELCLADDASTKDYIRPLLEKLMTEDERIKVVFRKENGHISEATNSAIGLTKGEYIGFLDNDDELAPNALYEVVKAINEDPSRDFIYTDEDKVNVRGKRFDPFYKPNWNEELLLGHNYITHFVVVAREIALVKAGGLRSEFNGSQDYDFVLRATEAAENIYHIPKILYHWRTVETSVAFDPQSKEYAYIAGQKAIEAALERRGVAGKVTMTKNYGAYRVDYTYSDTPLVSVICLGTESDMLAWLKAALETTEYPAVEFVVPTSAREAFGDVVQRFNYVESNDLNAQAKAAKGEYLIFARSDSYPEHSDWITTILNELRKDNVGLVCGKVINEEDVILNIGVTLNDTKQQVVYDQQGVSNKTIGYYFRSVLPRELYTATEDCLAVSKEDFLAVEGFDTQLKNENLGIDLSIKVYQQLHKKVLFDPYTVMVTKNTPRFSNQPEQYQQLADKWPAEKLHDPYANPHLL